MDEKMNASRSGYGVWNRRGFGIAATVALVGIVLGASAYDRAERKAAAIEREAAMSERASQIAREYHLLHQLGDGKTEEVRQMLSLELAGRLQELRSTDNPVEPLMQAWGEKLCWHILEDEKQHPGYFLATSNNVQVQEERHWASLQREMRVSRATAPTISEGNGQSPK